MQNAYLEMMEATQRAISRANDISATAEKVTNMLGVHKDDLARMGKIISGRFQAIREMLSNDEADFLAQIGTMRSELDSAIAKMQGVEPAAETPTEATQPAEAIEGGSNAEG